MRIRNRGFTLLELLIAMALFMVLGSALIALVTRAMDFLESGTGGAELQDKGADFLRAYVGDMENVAVERSLTPGPSVVRFLSNLVPIDSDGDGKVDYNAQRVAFVRTTNADFTDPVARMGGAKADAAAYYDGRDDKAEADRGDLLALGGLEEVLYMAVPEGAAPVDALPGAGGAAQAAVAPPDPGLMTLYRAVRSPVGGPGSLLDPATVKSIDDLKKVAQPFITGVLYFGARFWSARTTSWEALPTAGGADAPSGTWDSTRGILNRGTGFNEFLLAKGPESLPDPRDDVSPRMARVTLVFERTGRAGEGDYLYAGMDETAKRVLVGKSTNFATGSSLQYVKVGTEWMAYSGRGDDSFDVRERGAWGTVATSHRPGERVRTGSAVERTIMIPNYREDWSRDFRSGIR